MNERAYLDIISGRRQDRCAAALRAALRGLSWIYGGIIGLRNAYHDFWPFPKWLEIPVISIGNLTAGGTGKTPLTIWVCRRLTHRGLKTAVLSRGYKADQQGRADELLLIARHCPDVVGIANPHRHRAGQLAVERYQARVAVLDDGLQHRRLGRDLEITLIDALNPWGHDYLLPRGLLRERPTGLRRSDLVVITRCDQVEPDAVGRIEQRICALNPEIPIVRSVHEPTGFVTLFGEPATLPADARIGAFAGIARPEAFARTLADQGHAPADTYWFSDHHAYVPQDADALIAWTQDADLTALVTTEKDAVKLSGLDVHWPVPLVALRVEIAFWGQGDKILDGLIDDVLGEHQDG